MRTRTEDRIRSELRDVISKAVHGQNISAESGLAGAMLEIAYNVTTDRRHTFHPYVLAEILRTDGMLDEDTLNLADHFFGSSEDSVERRAIDEVLSLRHPDYFAR